MHLDLVAQSFKSVLIPLEGLLRRVVEGIERIHRKDDEDAYKILDHFYVIFNFQSPKQLNQNFLNSYETFPIKKLKKQQVRCPVMDNEDKNKLNCQEILCAKFKKRIKILKQSHYQFDHIYLVRMSNQAQYFELSNVGTLFPGMWICVTPYVLNKQRITLEDMKNLDCDIDIFGIKTQEDFKSLSKKSRQLMTRVKNIYEKQKKIYEDSLAQAYYQQPQQTTYNTYQQQQQYYQQQAYEQQQAAFYANNYGTYPQPTYSQQQTYAYGQGGYYNQQQPYAQRSQGHPYAQDYQYQGGYQNQGYPQQYNPQQYSQPNQQYTPQQEAYTSQETAQNYATEQTYEGQTSTHYQHRNNGYHRNNYHHNTHHQNQNQNQKYVAKSSTPEEVVPEVKAQVKPPVEPVPVKVEVVEEKKPEPPKPEKKKMSIQQIKQLIASVNDKEALKKSVDPTLVKQIQEVGNWKKTVEKIDIVQPAQNDKGGKPYKKEYQKGGKQEGGEKQQFVKGSKYSKNAPEPNRPTVFQIIVGKNENIDTAIFKKELSKKADNFADKKAKEQQSLDKVDKAKREIQFNLNRVAPENVKEIFSDMEKFAIEEQAICLALVESIIEKSWEQPKYAASYAKLSSYFARIESNKFKFGEARKDKKTNPFKHILVEKVQHSFDKKQKKQVGNIKQDIEKFAKETKNLLMGNVKFIAELIKIKLIHKKIIKYCVSLLIKEFIDGFYNFHKKNLKELNFYEYNFEALIEFLENLGDKYESIDEKTEKGKKVEEQDKQEETTKVGNYNDVEDKVRQFCQLKDGCSPETQIEGLNLLKADQYFNIFKVIDKTALPEVKDGKRLSALLQNLEERRFNKWRKHNVESEGPKKLKDLKNQEEQITPEQRQKLDLALLDDKMAKLLKKWVENDHKAVLQQLDVLAKKYTNEDLIGAYLKFVADDKKDFIPKRMEIFDVLLEKHLRSINFKKAWDLHFANIAMLVSEFPFCAAVLAKLLITYKEKNGGCKLADYFIKFDEDEQMDEYYFMDEVFQKLYHYSQDEGVKSKITPTPSAKLKHLL